MYTAGLRQKGCSAMLTPSPSFNRLSEVFQTTRSNSDDKLEDAVQALMMLRHGANGTLQRNVTSVFFPVNSIPGWYSARRSARSTTGGPGSSMDIRVVAFSNS